MKWLKFRDLIDTEMGIRAEVPTQTATTVLWRKNKMILGLVGGRCRECGTLPVSEDGYLCESRLWSLPQPGRL